MNAVLPLVVWSVLSLLPPTPPSTATWVESPQAADRVLYGDFEPPDAVAFGISEAWPETVRALSRAVPDELGLVTFVDINSPPDRLPSWVAQRFRAGTQTDVLTAPLDTVWIRDFGPLQVKTALGRTIWLDPVYGERLQDDQLPVRLGALMGVPVEELPIMLDGGAIASNGEGLCLMTRDYVDEQGIGVHEAEFRDELMPQIGCRLMVFVPALASDPTLHIDVFAQFVSPRRILFAESDPDSEDGHRLATGAEILQQVSDLYGLGLELVRVPIEPVGNGEYRTAVNGLNLGDRFLYPVFEAGDRRIQVQARQALRRALPGVRLIPIPADRPVEHNGAVHCLTLGLHLDRMKVARRARKGRRG